MWRPFSTQPRFRYSLWGKKSTFSFAGRDERGELYGAVGLASSRGDFVWVRPQAVETACQQRQQGALRCSGLAARAAPTSSSVRPTPCPSPPADCPALDHSPCHDSSVTACAPPLPPLRCSQLDCARAPRRELDPVAVAPPWCEPWRLPPPRGTALSLISLPLLRLPSPAPRRRYAVPLFCAAASLLCLPRRTPRGRRRRRARRSTSTTRGTRCVATGSANVSTPRAPRA